MKPAVILYKSLPEDLLARLNEHFDVTEVESLDAGVREKHPELFSKAVGIIGSGGKIDNDFLDSVPSLKVASTISAGYDQFDVDQLNARNIILMHTPTVLTETVADTLMALILASARRIVESAERVKAGEWRESITPDWFGVDVHHKTLGIVGMGRIGMALAKRAHAGFGMNILYNARKQHAEADKQYDAQYRDLDSLLAESDFVCLVLPLTDETYHIIGREQLAKMKSSAILINGGRGSIIDEPALIEALENQTILGAGLDVFEQEPLPVDSPLLRLTNVVALPHIGSATAENRYNMMADGVNNLITALTGRIEKNCVNPQLIK